jgi:hypothetical protein
MQLSARELQRPPAEKIALTGSSLVIVARLCWPLRQVKAHWKDGSLLGTGFEKIG